MLKKISKGTLLYIGFMCFLFVVIASVLYNQHKERLIYDNQIAELQDQIADANKYTQELKERSKYKESDEYLEKMARKQLKMVKPNEIVFIDENSNSNK